jgi:hypothetical protein
MNPEEHMQKEFDKWLRKTKGKYYTLSPMDSPAFPGEKISFTPFGFRHFLYNSAGKRRTLLASIMRMKVFDHAIEVIQNATIVVKDRPPIVKKDGKVVHLWSMIMVVRSKRICVVIRQKGNNGTKHFLSVMKKN